MSSSENHSVQLEPASDGSICHLLGFTILEWQSGSDFLPRSSVPPWWSLIDEDCGDDKVFSVDDRYPFLQNFLFDGREVWQADETDRLESGIWQYRTQSGSELMLEAFALNTGSHNLLIVQNVTHAQGPFKYLQQGRRSQLERLRDTARQRQMELELKANQADAKQLDKARTQFVATVSHEMRTPLTTILGMHELLAESNLDDEQRENLHALGDSAQSLFQIVRDLLDVARIEVGKLTTRKESFSPRELLSLIAKDYRPAAIERGLQFEIHVDQHLPDQLFTDLLRLRQILNNLIDNAIKFTENGSVKLCARPASNPTPAVVFTVSDTGVGIEADIKNRVFNAFVQHESTQNDGIGLGLAIAKRLSDAIGASITVESQSGKGSSFSLTVPCVKMEDQKTTSAKLTKDQTATEGNADAISDAATQLHLLVAEDNPINRKFITTFLKKDGHVVTEAVNGKQAIDAIAENDFDAVLMDYQMPVMSGCEAAMAVREIEKRTNEYLPIVAVTAHAFEKNRQLCMDAGMDFFVTKPFKFKELIQIVRKAAGLRRRNP